MSNEQEANNPRSRSSPQKRGGNAHSNSSQWRNQASWASKFRRIGRQETTDHERKPRRRVWSCTDMDIRRIQREFTDAQQTFAYLELHPTVDGKVYAKTALQTPAQMYVLSIRFPDTYPNEMPRVYVDTPAVLSAPHRYQTGNICYLHPSM